jgi:ATP-binding cassette, subfamily B, multidrug efflux pump
MMRGHGMMPTEEEKARNQGQVVRRLLALVRPYGTYLAAALGLTVITAATQGAGPFLIGQAIDRFIGGKNSSGLAVTMIVLAVVYVIGMLSTRYQIFFLSKMGQNVLAELRQEVFDKLEALDLQYLESSAAGDLMSRLVNDIEALNNFFSQALSQMIGAFFALLGIVVAMMVLNWQLGLAVLVMIPVLWFTTQWFSGMARQAFRKTRTTIGDVSAELEEELGGVKVAQAMNRTDENIRRFAERNAANRDANVSANAVTSAFAPAMELLSTLDTALVAALGGAMAISGRISVGVVVAFLQYVQNFFRPIQTVAQMWATAQSAFAAAERVFELLDRKPAVEDSPGAKPVQAISGHVRLENVSFAYDSGPLVLQDVSLEAQPGQTIAIVGPTGAGKTTLVSLIPRFYDATAGQVLIDGQDVRSLAQRSLRAQMGLVTQDPFLFSGTILENIRYGRLSATDEEVMEAARAASADEFIRRLPEGYKTEVGERGKLLSQGQRQLISIARAILADPRILIMDEATASVDTRTEAVIQKALRTLLEGRTSFVIAHRLSTIRHADQVVVIDKSRLVERGTHSQLLEKGGVYADLYNRQFYTPGEETAPAQAVG